MTLLAIWTDPWRKDEGQTELEIKLVRLTLRRMFETAIGDGAKKRRLQQKVAEAGRVNSDVGALLVDILASRRDLALLSIGRGSGLIVELVVGVIDEIFLGRHFGVLSWRSNSHDRVLFWDGRVWRVPQD